MDAKRIEEIRAWFANVEVCHSDLVRERTGYVLAALDEVVGKLTVARGTLYSALFLMKEAKVGRRSGVEGNAHEGDEPDPRIDATDVDDLIDSIEKTLETTDASAPKPEPSSSVGVVFDPPLPLPTFLNALDIVFSPSTHAIRMGSYCAKHDPCIGCGHGRAMHGPEAIGPTRCTRKDCGCETWTGEKTPFPSALEVPRETPETPSRGSPRITSMVGDCDECGHSIIYHVPIVGCMKCSCGEFV